MSDVFTASNGLTVTVDEYGWLSLTLPGRPYGVHTLTGQEVQAVREYHERGNA